MNYNRRAKSDMTVRGSLLGLNLSPATEKIVIAATAKTVRDRGTIEDGIETAAGMGLRGILRNIVRDVVRDENIVQEMGGDAAQEMLLTMAQELGMKGEVVQKIIREIVQEIEQEK